MPNRITHEFGAVTVFLLVWISPSVAQSPKNESAAKKGVVWSEYVYRTDGFAITLPENPNPHKDTQMENGTAYTAHLSSVTMTLHVGNFLQGCGNVFRGHLDAVQEEVRTAKSGPGTDFNRARRTDPSSVREFTSAGFPSFEFEQNVPNQDRAFRFYQRVICADKRLYVFDALWPNSSPKPEDLIRAIGSFRFVQK